MKVPEEYCVITADILKWIALVTMTLDHAAECVIRGFVASQGALLSQQGFQIIDAAYTAMRHLGRMAFPLFAFLLVEGFYRTRSRLKYIGRVFLTALVSEVPFDLMLYGKAVAWESQNTLFTLAIGLLAGNGVSGRFLSLCAMDYPGVSGGGMRRWSAACIYL